MRQGDKPDPNEQDDRYEDQHKEHCSFSPSSFQRGSWRANLARKAAPLPLKRSPRSTWAGHIGTQRPANSEGRERAETAMRMKANEVGDWLRRVAGKREHRQVMPDDDYLVLRPGPKFDWLM